jgi:tRNA U34 5-methylaminomethyl-2-thiouridine-forming methyltransferase MnmC
LEESNDQQPELVLTGDGSYTLFDQKIKEHFHSTHGARQESLHIYIESGLHLMNELPSVHILELGFGTGLNALLTAEYQKKSGQIIHYTSFDLYPLKAYPFLDKVQDKKLWMSILESNWGTSSEIQDGFFLHKVHQDILSASLESNSFNVIYHDAFSPESQAELWETPFFSSLYKALKKNGIWMSYCAKGQVRRSLQEVGFQVERIDGPPGGKREILRAIKK